MEEQNQCEQNEQNDYGQEQNDCVKNRFNKFIKRF